MASQALSERVLLKRRPLLVASAQYAQPASAKRVSTQPRPTSDLCQWQVSTVSGLTSTPKTDLRRTALRAPLLTDRTHCDERSEDRWSALGVPSRKQSRCARMRRSDDPTFTGSCARCPSGMPCAIRSRERRRRTVDIAATHRLSARRLGARRQGTPSIPAGATGRRILRRP